MLISSLTLIFGQFPCPKISLCVLFLDWVTRIYCEFNDVGNKYKQKVRSRISNLGDIKNPSLRQNVISGHIAPAKIAVMTTEVSSMSLDLQACQGREHREQKQSNNFRSDLTNHADSFV